ncbi:MAG: peptide deformylase [Candidatus Margulisiibacteriota bacterium]
MMPRKILLCGHPLLRKKSRPVKAVDNNIRKLVREMADTMYANKGAGLAAVQIGELKRMIVVDITEQKNQLMVFLNPKIIEKKGERIGIEACLSVPGFEGEVVRSDYVLVKARNLQFEEIIVEAEGYLAVALQHEIDHCDGILYVDKVREGHLRPISEEDEDDL